MFATVCNQTETALNSRAGAQISLESSKDTEPLTWARLRQSPSVSSRRTARLTCFTHGTGCTARISYTIKPSPVVGRVRGFKCPTNPNIVAERCFCHYVSLSVSYSNAERHNIYIYIYESSVFIVTCHPHKKVNMGGNVINVVNKGKISF